LADFLFLSRFRVVISEKTNKRLIGKGVEKVVAETCFPIKVAHGHLLDLIDKGVDTIFLPSVVSMPLSHPSLDRSFVCPYVQSFPYAVRSALDFKSYGVTVLTPVIKFADDPKVVEKELVKMGRKLGKSADEVREAIRKAQNRPGQFRSLPDTAGAKKRSKTSNPGTSHGCHQSPLQRLRPGVNLGLPQKLRDLGVTAIPMDMLPLDEVDLVDQWQDMYWKYGQKIYSAAQLVRNDPRLHAIYITNFACGPIPSFSTSSRKSFATSRTWSSRWMNTAPT